MMDSNLLIRSKLRHQIKTLIDAAVQHSASLDRHNVIDVLEAHRIGLAVRSMEDFFRLPATQRDRKGK